MNGDALRLRGSDGPVMAFTSVCLILLLCASFSVVVATDGRRLHLSWPAGTTSPDPARFESPGHRGRPDSLTPDDAAFLVLLQPEEQRIFQALSPDGRASFRRRYWNQRDPTPGTERNERYEEHLRRVEYARTMFSWPNVRGFDDRGEIYVRYGEPDERFMGGLFSESWRYEALGYYGVFDFVDEGSGYFRLGLPTKLSRRKGFFLARKTFAPFYAEVCQRIQSDPHNSPSLVIGEALMRRQADLVLRPREAMFDFFDRQNLRSWEFPFCWSVFKRNQHVQLELYYGIPIVLRDSLESVSSARKITVGFALLDSASTPLVRRRTYKRMVMKSTAERALGVGLEQAYFDRGGLFRVALAVTDSTLGRSGVYRFDVRIPDFASGCVAVSGLELAHRIGKGKHPVFSKPGDLVVVPNPARRYRRDQPCWLYFEIYNLTLDASGRSHYRTTLTLTRLGRDRLKRRGLFSRLAAIFRGQGGRSELSLVSEAHGTSRTEYVSLQLDIHQLAPGEYDLTVQVDDLEAGETASRGTKLWIAE